jgi:two-component system chemotaxis sensor kinase CheA
LGRDPGNLDVAELLWERDEDRADFRSGMGLVFSGKAKPAVVFDLFAKEILVGDHWLRVNFRALPGAEILLALTDVSRERALKELKEAEENRRSVILKAVSRRQYFADFVREAERLFSRVDALAASGIEGADMESFARDLHSLKGNAAFFCFDKTAHAAHEFEYHVSDSLVLGSPIDLAGNGASLRAAYASELDYILDSLGEAWLNELETIQIPTASFLKLERYIKGKYPQDKPLIGYVASCRSLPLRDLFARYPEMVQGLAVKLGKKVKPVAIEGGGFPVLPEQYEGLLSSLVHLVRNMVDHGIEAPRDRELAGKSPEGTITIELAKDRGGLRVVMADDGRGIDLGAVERRARESGLLPTGAAATKDELLELLFASGFSTSDEITEISGRGVGMGAVREAVKAVGGNIRVETEMGKGSKFEIVIPFRKEAS